MICESLYKIIPKKLIHKKIMYICITLKQFEVYLLFTKMGNQKLYKGSLQTIILKLLAQNEKMYGYEITQKVKELTKGELKITEGALYPALHKLEAEGLLDVEVLKVGNRLRKYYKLTESGSKETVNKLAEMQDFLKTMQQLVNPKFSLE
ncbi:PadR family transcriptional regulator (modular protein) [Tenacibaculum dicentrarchi]|uniref:PadR family transcriptional regulator (Modular protein) n=2 Tax=Tenacibaculum dicentrarchi TaxID=669041 RepID=A0ABP1EU89_9FLAO|nr:PadR family transcriptional regulator (modular protein) [Tenacibaculum dicentrarchi]SOS55035.1 PadR family transcriptional regulator (modular protein) [Tenacibaculum dicentrarchi]